MIKKLIECAPPDQNHGFSAEFCRVGDLRHLFGIRRGTAYALLRAGKIRGISLRKPGCKFGVRLIHVESVRAYLHSHFA